MLYEHEREREQWETVNYLEGEQKEMIELYMSKGLSKEDASIVIGILSKKTEFFVDIMMKEELELIPPEEFSLNSTVLHSILFESFSFFTQLSTTLFLNITTLTLFS